MPRDRQVVIAACVLAAACFLAPATGCNGRTEPTEPPAAKTDTSTIGAPARSSSPGDEPANPDPPHNTSTDEASEDTGTPTPTEGGEVDAPGQRSAPPKRLADAQAVGKVLGRSFSVGDVRAFAETLPADERRFSASDLLRVIAGRWLAVSEAKQLGVPRDEGDSDDAVVDRMLTGLFNAGTACKAIKDSDIQTEYAANRRKFVYPDVFEVADLIFGCCPKESAPCHDEAALACFERGDERMIEVFAELALLPGLDARVGRSTELAETDESLELNTYRFGYDYDSPHGGQPGRWLVLEKSITDAVRDRTAGEIVGPLRSKYGVHVMTLVEHKPKSNRSWDHPEVREQLTKSICDRLVRRTQLNYLTQLAVSTGLSADAATLKTLNAEMKRERLEAMEKAGELKR